jgi:hypothetical protein
MSRNLTTKEFYIKVSKESSHSVEDVKEIYLAMIDAVVDELMLYGEVNLPFLARLKASTTGGYEKTMPMSRRKEDAGKLVKRYIPQQYKVNIRPTEDFIKIVNCDKSTPNQIKKMRVELKKQKQYEADLIRQSKLVDNLDEAWAKAVAKQSEKVAKRRVAENKKKSKTQEPQKEPQEETWDYDE